MISTALLQTVVVSVRCRKCSETARRTVPLDVESMGWVERQVRCAHDNSLLFMWTTSTGGALNGGR